MKVIMDYDENIGNKVFEISPINSMLEGKQVTSIRFTLKDGRHHIWTSTVEDWVDPLQEQPADTTRKVKDNYRIFHNNRNIVLYPKNQTWILNGKKVSDDKEIFKQS